MEKTSYPERTPNFLHNYISPYLVCNSSQDSTEHIFFECIFIQNYWHLAETKLHYYFQSFDTWLNGSRLEEGSDLDPPSKTCLIALITSSFWLL